jgi:hypothetical protein
MADGATLTRSFTVHDVDEESGQTGQPETRDTFFVSKRTISSTSP